MAATAIPTVQFQNIPHELRDRRQWVMWRLEPDKDGRLTKVPYQTNGRKADSTGPKTWTTFEKVRDTFLQNPGQFSGVGFVFSTDDQFCGVDLDGCIGDDGAIAPDARRIIDLLSSYSEISPSGTGVKTWCLAKLPDGARHATTKVNGFKKFEVYDSARFFAVTGATLADGFDTIEDRQKELEQLYAEMFPPTAKSALPTGNVPSDIDDAKLLKKAQTNRKNGAEFSRLWQGDTSMHADDDSAADMALCSRLAFWWNRDPSAVDRMFRQSGLMREKWDSRRGDTTYGAMTIAKAIEGVRQGYSPNGGRGRSKPLQLPAGSAQEVSLEEVEHGPGMTKFLADQVRLHDHFAADAGGKLYVFKNGVYRDDGKSRIRVRVKQILQGLNWSNKWTTRRQNEVTEYIAVDAPRLWECPPMDRLNVANGLLDVATRILSPHDPAFLSPIQIPVNYDPGAKCDAWDKFVSEVFPPDAITVAYQIPAWLMLPDVSFQKAILMLGEGANGKSTYLTAVIAFLGKRNVSTVSLHRLEGDRFSPARLLGKLANICADLPSEHLAGTSTFKALVGSDTISGERKFVDSFDFDPYARLIFSANHPPRSADSTHAFFRRWLVIPFTRTFSAGGAHEPSPRDVLDARLSNPVELSGLLNRALGQLDVIQVLHGITESESMKAAWSELRATTDPIAIWLDANTIDFPDAFITKAELLAAYNKDCEQNGRPQQSKTAFSLALKRLRPIIDEAQRTVHAKVCWVWLGIGIRDSQSSRGSRASRSFPYFSPSTNRREENSPEHDVENRREKPREPREVREGEDTT